MYKRVGFIIFAILCIAIGFYPLMYFIVDRTFGLLDSKTHELLSDTVWNSAFYGHIIFGGVALVIGWMQFIKRLRIKRLRLHRQIGMVYIIAVIISGVCGLYIGYFATGGWFPALGFILLGLIWLSSTIKAFVSVKNRDIIAHQKWMIVSYAACFAAVTLRIWLPLLMAAFGEFLIAYKIVAWLCWVPNMIVAYFIIRRLKPV